MRLSPQRGIISGLLAGTLIAAATPADAFSLFGFRLWGAQEDDDRIEVIDPLDYRVTFDVTGDTALEGALKSASSLWNNREDPASGQAGLISRAKGDYRRILAALYDAGYYGGYISITLHGREAADLTLATDLPAPVPVTVSIDTGPAFLFGALSFVNPPPPPDQRRSRAPTFASIDFQTGQPARASIVDRASVLAVGQWRNRGHPKAAETGREVIADHADDTLDVRLALDPGREAHYGPRKVTGTTRVDPEFIEFMTGLPEGRRFSADEVADSEARLGRLGVFRTTRIEEAPEILPDGGLPLTIKVEDRKPRTLGFGGTYSTLDGLGLEAYWLHRNLLGRAEQLRFDASVSGLLESINPDDFDYSLGVSFLKPGVYRPDTNFVTGALAQRLDYDNYRETSIGANIGVTQQFGNRLTGDLGLNASRARFEDIFGTREFTILGITGNLTYDSRNDPLDATRGIYVSGMVQPFYEAERDNPGIRGTIEGRAYKSLVGEDKFVMAGRLKLGSYYGPGAAESPPDLLFFTGGGGSVRGYAYRSIGVPTTVDGSEGTVGGRGLFEGSAEARLRFTDTMGAVGFADAGFVTANPRFAGDNELRVGVGAGFRYFTGFGPLRVDVATPLDRRPQDSIIALYIGIGQAF